MFTPIRYSNGETTYYFDQDDIRNAVVYESRRYKDESTEFTPIYRVEITVAPNININETFLKEEDAILRAEWWMQLAYNTKWANLRKVEVPENVLGN